MPSARENIGGAVTGYGQIKHEPNDQILAAERLFRWQNFQQSATPPGQADFNTYSETTFPTAQPPTFRAPEALSTSDQDAWNYDGRHEFMLPQVSSTHQFGNTVNLSHDQPGSFCFDSSIQQPILPLPTRQRPLWTDSTVANTMAEAFIPNSQVLQPYPQDTASRTNPAITSSAPGRPATCGPGVEPVYGDLCFNEAVDGCETTHSSKEKDPCYAKLIYQALMEAPGHKMILRDIYAWIAQNTDKAKDPLSKGWQNSVRHNLSMNGDFLKVELIDPQNKSKKGFIWVLEPSAVRKGIQSTTRFRSKPGEKKTDHPDGADCKRQQGGKRSGKAAKRNSRTRSSSRLRRDDTKLAQYYHNTGTDSAASTPTRARQYPHSAGVDSRTSTPTEAAHPFAPSMGLGNPNGLPYWIPTPPPSIQSSPQNSSYYGCGDILVNSEPQANQYPFDGGFEHDCEPMLGPNTSGIKFEDHFLGSGFNCLA